MKTLFSASFLLVPALAFSQQLHVQPTGRILGEGAVYFDGGDSEGLQKFVDGVSLSDIRAGVKASYGNWKMRADLGWSFSKLSMQDVYIEYDFNDTNLMRGGYFVEQFGLDAATSASMKPTMEETTSNAFFYSNNRRLGVSWHHYPTRCFVAASVFVEPEAVKKDASEMGKQAYGVNARAVWRPQVEPGRLFQIGGSVNASTPRYNDDPALNHTSFVFKADFPTRVSRVTDLDAVVDHARWQYKLAPELMAARGRLAFASQFYHMLVFRKDGCSGYTANGVYAMVRGLLIGDCYRSDQAVCGFQTPRPGSLELIGCYDYTNASDASAKVWGGVSNDLSCTLNYYINPYMIARLRYSYTSLRDRRPYQDPDAEPTRRHVNTIQARLQIIF